MGVTKGGELEGLIYSAEVFGVYSWISRLIFAACVAWSEGWRGVCEPCPRGGETFPEGTCEEPRGCGSGDESFLEEGISKVRRCGSGGDGEVASLDSVDDSLLLDDPSWWHLTVRVVLF